MTDRQRKRRRSAHVSTLLVGGAAALMLSGCGGDDDVQQTDARIFPTVEACLVEFSQQECDSAFEQAKQLHLQTTPRFDSAAACEAAIGNGACQPMVLAQPNGSMSNVFMPALMGFMLAKALQPPSPQYGGYIGSGGGYYYPRPIYIDRDGFMHSGRGNLGRTPVSRDSFTQGKTGFSMQTPVSGKSGQVGTTSKSTNRGGFGASSAKFGGGGS